MPECASALPPSGKACYLALHQFGPMTQAELSEVTGLPQRTVRYALDRMANTEGILDEQPDMNDARRSIYGLSHRTDAGSD